MKFWCSHCVIMYGGLYGTRFYFTNGTEVEADLVPDFWNYCPVCSEPRLNQKG